MAELELDPRWSWVGIPDMAGGTVYLKGRCNHLEVVPVTLSLTGEEVATLCRTCDTTLPPGARSPVPVYDCVHYAGRLEPCEYGCHPGAGC